MILIQQSQWQEKGLAPEQQIALLLKELNQILQHSSPEIIEIQISVGIQILPEIAKVKALQMLVENLCKCYFPNSLHLASFSGKTNSRYYTSNEPELNLIRQSLQCFILQSCNITKIDIDSFNQQKKSQNISQNINTLLQEESHFKNIQDSISGAVYIEKLSDELAQKSWALFQEIESKSNVNIEQWIKEFHEHEIQLYKKKKKILVGANKYQTKETGDIYTIEKEL